MPSKWPFSYVIALQILYTFLSFTVVNVTVNLMFHIMLGISFLLLKRDSVFVH